MLGAPQEQLTGAAQTPDERAFRHDVAAGAFRRGAVRGRWRLVTITWPHAVIAVSAAERAGSPSEYGFRFELTNYPQSPPTAAPWDLERDLTLAPTRWPTGRSRLVAAFNPGWNAAAIYIPCDRLAIQGHDAWHTQHPSMIWQPTGDITQYLSVLYELLNSGDYTGARDVPARA
jgi:hypothetical protein